MEIIKTNIDQKNKKEVYNLTKSSAVNVKDLDADTIIEVDKWAYFTDEKGSKVLSIVDAGGTKFCTISATFAREFMEIAELMGSDEYSIVVKKGKTKAGRDFVTCELDCG